MHVHVDQGSGTGLTNRIHRSLNSVGHQGASQSGRGLETRTLIKIGSTSLLNSETFDQGSGPLQPRLAPEFSDRMNAVCQPFARTSERTTWTCTKVDFGSKTGLL